MKVNQNGNKNSTRSKNSKARRQKFLRKLKFYSSAAGLGAFACSSTAQGVVVFYDVPDVTITNNASGISQFIDIHADGPSNPDGSPPEWQIIAPGAQNQIRISGTPLSGAVNDERGGHVGLVPYTPVPAPSVPGAGEGNQVLSLFGNPGSAFPTDPNPGYYVESVPLGFPVSRATMSPSFYGDVAARGLYAAYNKIDNNRFVGLQWDFDGTGDVRYGIAQIDVNPPSTSGSAYHNWSATLTWYSFEMTPNVPYKWIPEPSSLALLAAGGGGLALVRRRRSSQK